MRAILLLTWVECLVGVAADLRHAMLDTSSP